MAKYKVTLFWPPSPIDRRSAPSGMSQSEVVEAESSEAAKSLVLAGYDFAGDARKPERVEVTETDEADGLQPVKDYDYTKAARIRKRRDILNDVAQTAGWVNWSEYETAVKNQLVSIAQK